MSALFEDAPFVDEAFDETDEHDDFEESFETDVEPYVSKTISDKAPEISEQQEALVEAWWSEYQDMKDPDQILDHLHGFFQAHPELVDSLGLHYEVLFELGAALVRHDRAGEYIELLKHVRQTFPEAYLKSFSYYDRDIIAYSVIEQGCGAEIQPYLDWFKEYPDTDADNLFSVIYFLMVSECDETLMDLLEAVYDPIIRSPQVIGGGEALDILVYAYCTDFLDAGGDRASPEPLIERLKTLKARLRDCWYDPKSMKETLDLIAGELDASFLDSFRSTKNFVRYYEKVTLNFMGWLHGSKGFSGMKAQFYRQQVLHYLLDSIPSGKRPKQPFTFTKQLLNRTLARNAQSLFSLDPKKALSSINAMYWFAEYLAQRNFISAELGVDVQRWCEEMWTSASASLRHESIEVGAFKTFPS